jgi:hypothetical protein
VPDPIGDRDHLSRVLTQVAEAARDYFARVDQLPAGGTARRDEATGHFAGELPEDGDGSLATAFRPAIANCRTTERDVDIILGVVRGLGER